MNDEINIKLKLTKINLYISSLSLAIYELRKKKNKTAQGLKELKEDLIKEIDSNITTI